MYQAHKIGLDPTQTQEQLFWEHAGYSRYAWNWAIDEVSRSLNEDNKILTGYELQKTFNAIKREIAPWSTVLSQNAANKILVTCGEAWRRFIRDLKKKRNKKGRPKYKSRYRSKIAFRADGARGSVRTKGNRITLPKIGSVRMFQEARFDEEVRECVVSYDGIRWHASLVYKLPDAPQKTEGSTVGVDVGLRKMAVTYDGENTQVFDNLKPLKANLEKLAEIDQGIARSKEVHGKNRSSNRRKAKYRARKRLFTRMTNARMDSIHKATSSIVKAGRIVCVEDLSVEGWKHKPGMARSTLDAAPATVLRLLEHKCRRDGVQVVKASKWFPSSKTCSTCQAVNSDLGFQEVWRCPTCSTEHNRDVNAATNLWRQGLALHVDNGTNQSNLVRPEA